MTGIAGKVIAITGASSGVGRATAVLLASRRAKLSLGARREEQLQSVAEEIERAGGHAICRSIDVS